MKNKKTVKPTVKKARAKKFTLTIYPDKALYSKVLVLAKKKNMSKNKLLLALIKKYLYK